MDATLPFHLLKLFETVKKGAKGFHIQSIRPHLDILTDYGAQCKSVTVLGIETGCSCVAFLASGCKKLFAYDANIHPNLSLVRQAAQRDGIPFRLIQKDNLKAKLRRTDLLFIDTDHWYGQIKAELERHHGSVSRWILMHDTETFAFVNPFDGRPGMRAAIFEFLEQHPEWDLKDHFATGDGLTILERIVPLKKRWIF